jgi:hypothetical protein
MEKIIPNHDWECDSFECDGFVVIDDGFCSSRLNIKEIERTNQVERKESNEQEKVK